MRQIGNCSTVLQSLAQAGSLLHKSLPNHLEGGGRRPARGFRWVNSQGRAAGRLNDCIFPTLGSCVLIKVMQLHLIEVGPLSLFSVPQDPGLDVPPLQPPS